MQTLVSKLETIAKETGDNKEGSTSSSQKGGDEFQRLKACMRRSMRASLQRSRGK